MIGGGKMKRLGIYLIYDKDKIIDSYIDYILGELKTCIDHLVVVCNMPEVIRGADILEKHADEIFFRENIGFDAGGFKEALFDFLGWDIVLEYEELVLANDSFFGPFKPMREIFFKMDMKPYDFWGLTKHASWEPAGMRSFSEHIQSYFFVIRSAMLHDAQFIQYWKKIPFYREFWDVVICHEEKFTSYFNKLGYTYGVLADTEINDSKTNFANNYSQYESISYELIKKRNCPFLKKQQIAYNTLSQQTQENLFQAIRYIDENTDYDVNLIWRNLIRTMNMADLQRSLHLQYIIPLQEKEMTVKHSIAIIIFAEYKEAAEYVLEYLKPLEKEVNYFVQIIPKNSEVLEAYKGYAAAGTGILFKQKCSLTEFCQYDFVCVLHDADMTSDVKPSCTGKSYFYCIWENLV